MDAKDTIVRLRVRVRELSLSLHPASVIEQVLLEEADTLIIALCAERDAAVESRDEARVERDEAVKERDVLLRAIAACEVRLGDAKAYYTRAYDDPCLDKSGVWAAYDGTEHCLNSAYVYLNGEASGPCLTAEECALVKKIRTSAAVKGGEEKPT